MREFTSLRFCLDVLGYIYAAVTRMGYGEGRIVARILRARVYMPEAHELSRGDDLYVWCVYTREP